MKLIYLFGLLMLLLTVQSALAASSTLYLSGSGGSGTSITDVLITSVGSSSATWTSTADGQTATFTYQYAAETDIDTGPMNISIWCDKTSSAGGDQVYVTYVIYDCGTTSDCSSPEATLCTGSGSIDCDNGEGGALEETDSCTPSAGTIEANEYFGIVFTAGSNKAPKPYINYDDATYDSYIAIGATEVVANTIVDWTVNIADSPDPTFPGDDITYTATGTDGDGDQYRMTVCDTNSLTAGYPGTCNGGNTLCTSSATNSGTQTSCAYTVTAARAGTTLTAYGFLCDANSGCNTSTSTTTTILDNLPDWTANLADSPDPVDPGATLTYTGTATDYEGDQYRMTVCSSNSITNGYPGTCTATTLCTSDATNSGVQTSCTYVPTYAQAGTLTAYGFICDAGNQSCNTSTSTTTVVTRNKSGLVPEGSGQPFYTNMSNPAGPANFSCLANMNDTDSCNVTWYVYTSGTVGDTHEFFVYANNTGTPTPVYGDYHNFTIQAPVGGGDTCDYTSGDWTVDCTESCTVDTNANLGGNDFTMSGTGTITLLANVTNWGIGTITNNCQVVTTGRGMFLQ